MSGGECLFAEVALDLVDVIAIPVLGLFQVHFLMFGQIRLLRETLVAAWLRAHKRPLACVNSQMVEEVVPLAEEELAVVMVALKDLDLAHRPWVLVLKDSELASVRHSFLYLDRVHRKTRTVLHVDLGILGDCLCDLIIRKIVTTDNHRGVTILIVLVSLHNCWCLPVGNLGFGADVLLEVGVVLLAFVFKA